MDFGQLGGGLVRLLGKRMLKEPGDASTTSRRWMRTSRQGVDRLPGAGTAGDR
jgi:hypothetical protein